MGVPSGANSRPPCASKLRGPVPKYEFPEDGGFSGLISFSAHSFEKNFASFGSWFTMCRVVQSVFRDLSKTWASCFIVGFYGIVL